MKRNPRPCDPSESVARAQALAEVEAKLVKPHRYGLGTGNYFPEDPTRIFTTFTDISGNRDLRSDCMGPVAYSLRIPRKRPGFNHGSWSVVTDWVNTDSLIQDAEHEQDLVMEVDEPQPGDLLVWPSIYSGELSSPFKGRTGNRRRIGHVSLVVRVDAGFWKVSPKYERVRVAQCSSRHTPAIHLSDALAWKNKQRTQWGTRHEWRSRILRPIR